MLFHLSCSPMENVVDLYWIGVFLKQSNREKNECVVVLATPMFDCF